MILLKTLSKKFIKLLSEISDFLLVIFGGVCPFKGHIELIQVYVGILTNEIVYPLTGWFVHNLEEQYVLLRSSWSHYIVIANAEKHSYVTHNLALKDTYNIKKLT